MTYDQKRRITKVLNNLDEVLQTDIGAAVWDVLSALRGPDDTSRMELKKEGTIPIRRAAFPKTARMDNWVDESARNLVDFYSSSQLSSMKAASGTTNNYHFNGHIERAVLVLKELGREP